MRRHLPGVWRYLRMLGASPELADDLTQDAFVTALHKQAIDRDPAALGAFLRRTARFLFLRSQRRARGAAALADAVDLLWQRDCEPDDGEGLVEAVRQCVGELTDRARRAMQRVYGDGEARADVARELGLNENGLKTMLQRAREQVRECVSRRRER